MATLSLFPCPKIVGFWLAGFVLVKWIQALRGLVSAKSWAFLNASKELVLRAHTEGDANTEKI